MQTQFPYFLHVTFFNNNCKLIYLRLYSCLDCLTFDLVTLKWDYIYSLKKTRPCDLRINHWLGYLLLHTLSTVGQVQNYNMGKNELQKRGQGDKKKKTHSSKWINLKMIFFYLIHIINWKIHCIRYDSISYTIIPLWLLKANILGLKLNFLIIKKIEQITCYSSIIKPGVSKSIHLLTSYM